MKAEDWLFALVPESDVATLAGFDPALLGAGVAPQNPRTWLGAVLETIAGRRTYELRIRALLDAEEPFAALRLAANAEVRAVQLPEELASALDLVWSRVRDAAGRQRATAASRFEERELTKDERDLVDLLRTELDAQQLPADRPTLPGGLKQGFDAIERIGQLTVEAERLQGELDRERVKRKEQLQVTALAASKALVDLLFHDDPARRASAAEVLAAVPVLVFDERLDDLRAISTGRLDIVGVRAGPAAPTRASQSVIAPSAPPQGAGTGLELSRASIALIERTPAAVGAVISTSDDLRRARREAENHPLHRQAQLLICASRAASNPALANALLGQGLLVTAKRFLFEENKVRLARSIATDAVAAIVASAEHYDSIAAEEAVMILLLCRLWAPLQAQGRRGRSQPAELRHDLGKFIRWIEEAGELEAIGQVWARASMDVAPEILNVVCPHTANVDALWTACALALVRQENLIDAPEVALEKLLTLLAPASPPALLREATLRMARELAAAEGGRIGSASRNAILRELDVVEGELAKLPAGTSVPRDVIAEQLPSAIRHLVEAPTLEARPQLSIPRSLESIFIGDRSSEIRLPVIVENGEKAAATSDLHVSVTLDVEGGRETSRIEPRGQPIAYLAAGESAESSFYWTPDRRVTDASRADLRIEVLANNHVIAKGTVPIALRHESRRERKSPYQPGIALEADEGFVGREKARKLITDALLADAVRVPLVVGIRRVGKTSLLHAIRREPRVTARYVTKYLSFESRPYSDTSVQFLLHLAESLRDLLAQSVGKHQAAALHFAREEFRADPYSAFERFTTAVEGLAPKKGLLLVFDEFDKLLAIVENGKQRDRATAAPLRPDEVLQPEVFGALRAMIMRGRSIRVLIAGLPRLLQNLGYEERFFGMLEPVRVAGFTEDEARSVLAFAQPTMKLSASAETRVLRASGGQPYLLQVICHLLYVHMLEEGRDLVTPQDVEDVLEKYVLPNQTYFTDFVNLMDRGNMEIVKTVARLQRDTPSRRFVSLAEIENDLAPTGLGGAALRVQLDELTSEERPLLEKISNGRFRLTIGLLADHLLR
jgi:hypothetical protein